MTDALPVSPEGEAQPLPMAPEIVADANIGDVTMPEAAPPPEITDLSQPT
jgi:hypothetical protein